MLLDPSKVFSDGFCFEDIAVGQLLCADICFINSRAYAMAVGEKAESETTVVFVLCNDVFAPCADAEDLPIDQIEPLYRAVIANKRWGAVHWVCARRNERPWKLMADAMCADGAWTPEMEALPVRDEA